MKQSVNQSIDVHQLEPRVAWLAWSNVLINWP